jgi:hypothetical protein
LWLEGSDEMPKMWELDGDGGTVLWQMWRKKPLFLQNLTEYFSKIGNVYEVKKVVANSTKLLEQNLA